MDNIVIQRGITTLRRCNSRSWGTCTPDCLSRRNSFGRGVSLGQLESKAQRCGSGTFHKKAFAVGAAPTTLNSSYYNEHGSLPVGDAGRGCRGSSHAEPS